MLISILYNYDLVQSRKILDIYFLDVTMAPSPLESVFDSPQAARKSPRKAKAGNKVLFIITEREFKLIQDIL